MTCVFVETYCLLPISREARRKRWRFDDFGPKVISNEYYIVILLMTSFSIVTIASQPPISSWLFSPTSKSKSPLGGASAWFYEPLLQVKWESDKKTTPRIRHHPIISLYLNLVMFWTDKNLNKWLTDYFFLYFNDHIQCFLKRGNFIGLFEAWARCRFSCTARVVSYKSREPKWAVLQVDSSGFITKNDGLV